MICRLVEEIESMGTGEGLKIECSKRRVLIQGFGSYLEKWD